MIISYDFLKTIIGVKKIYMNEQYINAHMLKIDTLIHINELNELSEPSELVYNGIEIKSNKIYENDIEYLRLLNEYNYCKNNHNKSKDKLEDTFQVPCLVSGCPGYSKVEKFLKKFKSAKIYNISKYVTNNYIDIVDNYVKEGISKNIIWREYKIKF